MVPGDLGGNGRELRRWRHAEAQRVVIFVDTDITAGPLTSGGQFLIEITLEE